jgi:hypothetical protein
MLFKCDAKRRGREIQKSYEEYKDMWSLPRFGRQNRSDPLSLCQTAWNMDAERWVAMFLGLISRYRS